MEGASEASNKQDPKLCGVCGDKALGYNFCAVTCESCKAFFRRNALTNKDFRCPFNEQCEITAITRRFCQKCRLEKCFAIGMRKDYIMSEEDKLQKRQKIELNRAKKRTLCHKENGKKIKREYSSEESLDYNCKSVESSPDNELDHMYITNSANIVSVIKSSSAEVQQESYCDETRNFCEVNINSTSFVQEDQLPVANNSSMIRTILNPTPSNINSSSEDTNSPLLTSLINNNDIPCNMNNTTAVQSSTDVTRDVLQDVQRLITPLVQKITFIGMQSLKFIICKPLVDQTRKYRTHFLFFLFANTNAIFFQDSNRA